MIQPSTAHRTFSFPGKVWPDVDLRTSHGAGCYGLKVSLNFHTSAFWVAPPDAVVQPKRNLLNAALYVASRVMVLSNVGLVTV